MVVTVHTKYVSLSKISWKIQRILDNAICKITCYLKIKPISKSHTGVCEF